MSGLYPIGIQYFEKIGEGNMLMWKDCMGLSTGVGGGLLFSKSSMRSGKSPLVPALVLYYTLENRK